MTNASIRGSFLPVRASAGDDFDLYVVSQENCPVDN